MTLGGSIDPIGSLFLSIEVHETCVCGITSAFVLRARNKSAAGWFEIGRTICGALQRVPAIVQDKAMPKRASLVFVLSVAPDVMLKQASNWWMVHWKRRRRAETFDGKSILRVSSAVRLLNVLVRLLVLAVMLASAMLKSSKLVGGPWLCCRSAHKTR